MMRATYLHSRSNNTVKRYSILTDKKTTTLHLNSKPCYINVYTWDYKSRIRIIFIFKGMFMLYLETFCRRKANGGNQNLEN